MSAPSRAQGCNLGDVLAFLVPALLSLEIEIGGRLFASEFVLMLLLPFLLVLHGRRLREKHTTFLIGLCCVWFAGLFVTDIIRETAFADYSRGWAKVFVFLLDFVAIVLLIGRSIRRWTLFGVGLALGMLLDFVYSPSQYAQDYPWKFGIGMGVTFLLILLSSTLLTKRGRWQEILIGSAAVLNLYLGFRSLGLVCGLTAFYIAANKSNVRGSAAPRLRSGMLRYLTIFTVVAVGGYGVFVLYVYAASAGYLGELEQWKYELQSSGELGVLLGGRAELAASLQAIVDAPLVGHGSWAKDPYYVDMVTNRMASYGYQGMGSTQSDLIPSHSYLFGSWVEAGVLGGLFWCWVLLLAVEYFRRYAKSNLSSSPWVVFCTFLLMWNILFSPFGAEQRILAAYQIAMVVLSLFVLRNSRKSTPLPVRRYGL